MPFRIVDHLEAVDIADHNAERFASILNQMLKFNLHFVICGLVLRMGQFIPAGKFIRQGKFREMLLFLPDFFLAVFNTDDEMAVIGRIGHRHTCILCLSAFRNHPVILIQLPSVFQPRDQIILIQEEANPVSILKIDQPLGILSCGREKILPFMLYFQLPGFLLCGKFGVL